MKLPKFMKGSSTRSRDEKATAGRQLLITELQFQPHKNAAAIMNFDKSLYMTPKGLATLTPKFGENRQPAASGRYVKSAQPKRLQRTPKCAVGASKPAPPAPTQITYYTVQKLGMDSTLTTPAVFRQLVSAFLPFALP